MNISLVNNYTNLTFSARNKDIRKADDIQRHSRQVFPMLSPTYIDEFYISAKQEKDTPKIQYLNNEMTAEINAARKSHKLKSMTEDNGLCSHPMANFYLYTLLNLTKNKIGNCKEASIATIGMLASKGYYDSHKVNLVLRNEFINKQTKKVEFSSEIPLDHAFVITSLNEESRQDDNNKIVLDSWMGFADSVSGAKNRYKHLFTEDKLAKLKQQSIETFKTHLKLYGEEFDMDKYEMRHNFVFNRSDNLTQKDMKEFGMFVKMMEKDIKKGYKYS